MGMEPEAKSLLKRVALSLFLGLSWLFINMTIGIYFDLLPVYGKLRVGNIIFYSFFLITLFFLIRFFTRTWKKKFPHG
jgi:hypothetical protein